MTGGRFHRLVRNDQGLAGATAPTLAVGCCRSGHDGEGPDRQDDHGTTLKDPRFDLHDTPWALEFSQDLRPVPSDLPIRWRFSNAITVRVQAHPGRDNSLVQSQSRCRFAGGTHCVGGLPGGCTPIPRAPPPTLESRGSSLGSISFMTDAWGNPGPPLVTIELRPTQIVATETSKARSDNRIGADGPSDTERSRCNQQAPGTG